MLKGNISNLQAPVVAIDLRDILVKKPQNLFQRILGLTIAYELDESKISYINHLWQNGLYSIYLVRIDLDLTEDEVISLLGNRIYYTRIDSLQNLQELQDECVRTYKYFFSDICCHDTPFLTAVHPFNDINCLI